MDEVRDGWIPVDEWDCEKLLTKLNTRVNYYAVRQVRRYSTCNITVDGVLVRNVIKRSSIDHTLRTVW